MTGGERILSRLWEEVSGILFPRRCPVCDDIVMPRGALICPECRKKVHPVKDRCFHCGRPVTDPHREYCIRCSSERGIFAGGYSLMQYDGTARRILLDLKTGGKRDNADYVAAEMASRLGRSIKALPAKVLIPVPISPAKRRQRGFNQAELLARRTAEALDLSVRKDLLIRVRDTAPLKTQGPGSRQKSLERAFAVKKSWPKELTDVILVDDIYTTGSTAAACAKVLKAAGAKRVWILSAASAADR